MREDPHRRYGSGDCIRREIEAQRLLPALGQKRKRRQSRASQKRSGSAIDSHWSITLELDASMERANAGNQVMAALNASMFGTFICGSDEKGTSITVAFGHSGSSILPMSIPPGQGRKKSANGTQCVENARYAPLSTIHEHS